MNPKDGAGTSTPTRRRWQRLVLDDDSEEDNEETKPYMETSEGREQLQKLEHDTACAEENEPVHACAADGAPVTTGFFPPDKPPGRSSNPMQMLNLLFDTSSLPAKPTPKAVPPYSVSTVPQRPPPPIRQASTSTEPTKDKEVSITESAGESIPCGTHRSASQSQADEIEEAEDSGVEGPDENLLATPKTLKVLNTTLPKRSQSCEPSFDTSKPTLPLDVEENEDSTSSSEHSPNQDLLESQQLSVSSLSSPPVSPTDSKVESPLENDTDGMIPPTSAVETDIWNRAMALESEAKKFAQASRAGRDRLRTKNQDQSEEALPRKPSQSTIPSLVDGTVASQKNDKVKDTCGANSVVTDHTSTVETAQPDEEFEQSSAKTCPAPEEPKTLVEDVLEAVPQSNRKAFTTGDVAIILDTGDLTKTLLVPSTPLLEQTTLLNRDFSRDVSPGSKLKHVFVLAVNENVSNMPRLICITDGLLERGDLTNCGCETYKRALETATLVKEEPNQEQHEDAAAQIPPRINWMKAFEAFLYIVTNTKTTPLRGLQPILRIIGSNAKAALPQIEGILEFAKHFEAIDAVATTLTFLNHGFIGNGTLYPAIADEAASWLLIAQEIEDEAVFKEAFVHVAGRWPEWPWYKPKASISDNLQNNIEVARNEIEIEHQKVQVKLLRQTLTNNHTTSPVSQRNAPYKYDVVCFWSQWIGSHFDYLEAKRESNALGDPMKSDFCDHPNDTCLSIAKLYRAIAKGGDTYLPFESMMKKWDKKTYDSNEAEQRDALAELKRDASVIVEEIVKSSLQYGLPHELDYLTCIKVEAKNIPWKMHEEDRDEEMEI